MEPKLTKWVTLAFVRALLFGGTVQPTTKHPNKVGNLDGFNPKELQIVIDEGRRQLDLANARFEDVQRRAQTLLGIGLATLGFAAGGFGRVQNAGHSIRHTISLYVWILAMVLVLLGVALSAAVVVVKGVFDQTDTPLVTNLERPLQRSLAGVYAEAVRRGEITVADRVTVFRLATRYTLWGAVVTSVVYIVTLR